MYADIAIQMPQDISFTYKVPDYLADKIKVGQKALISFKNRVTAGIIIRLKETCDLGYTKDIIKLIDERPVITEYSLQLAKWISGYYVSSMGQTLQMMAPKQVTRKNIRKTIDYYKLADKQRAKKYMEELPGTSHRKKLLIKIMLQNDELLDQKQISRLTKIPKNSLKSLVEEGILSLTRKDRLETIHKILRKVERHKLTPEQQKAISGVLNTKKTVSLLFGVTGSGKTEIYSSLAEEMKKRGKTSMILVPEIALTPQAVSYFKNRFKKNVAVLHSYLTPSERRLEWESILNGNIDIVIGTRSAIFAPLKNIGLIVIDEEHDNSYKEHSSPQYHATMVAIKRGEIEGAKVLLGSATPSVESYYRALKGEYELFKLQNKIHQVQEPQITLIDMREERMKQRKFTVLSKYLVERIRDTLEQKNQALLFLNRRGYSTYLYCFRCKFTYMCEKCDSPLALHKSLNSYFCHYCIKEYNIINKCPRCGYDKLKNLGVGTEKVFEDIGSIFDCRVARMDSDTMRSRKDYVDLIEKLYSGEIDILIGTQMASKGMDVERLTLAGIIYAEANLSLPDYRTVERTFQLIHQSAGRAGRRKERAEIVIQTSIPEHFVMKLAKQNSYEEFYKIEIEHRREALYPPFCRLIRILSEDVKKETAESRIQKAAERLSNYDSLTILGPAKAFFNKLSGRYRYHLMIKMGEYSTELTQLLKSIQKESNYKLKVDIDPIQLL